MELLWDGNPTTTQKKIFSTYRCKTMFDVIREYPGILMGGETLRMRSSGKREDTLNRLCCTPEGRKLSSALTACLDRDGSFVCKQFEHIHSALGHLKWTSGMSPASADSGDDDDDDPPPAKQPKLEVHSLIPPEEQGRLAQLLVELEKRHHCLAMSDFRFHNDTGKLFLMAFLSFVSAVAAPPHLTTFISTAISHVQKLAFSTNAVHVNNGTVASVEGVADVGMIITEEPERAVLLGEIKSKVDVVAGSPGEGQLVAAMIVAFVNQEGRHPVWGVSMSPQMASVYSITRVNCEIVIECYGSVAVNQTPIFLLSLIPYIITALRS